MSFGSRFADEYSLRKQLGRKNFNLRRKWNRGYAADDAPWKRQLREAQSGVNPFSCGSRKWKNREWLLQQFRLGNLRTISHRSRSHRGTRSGNRSLKKRYHRRGFEQRQASSYSKRKVRSTSTSSGREFPFVAPGSLNMGPFRLGAEGAKRGRERRPTGNEAVSWARGAEDNYEDVYEDQEQSEEDTVGEERARPEHRPVMLHRLIDEGAVASAHGERGDGIGERLRGTASSVGGEVVVGERPRRAGAVSSAGGEEDVEGAPQERLRSENRVPSHTQRSCVASSSLSSGSSALFANQQEQRDFEHKKENLLRLALDMAPDTPENRALWSEAEKFREKYAGWKQRFLEEFQFRNNVSGGRGTSSTPPCSTTGDQNDDSLLRGHLGSFAYELLDNQYNEDIYGLIKFIRNMHEHVDDERAGNAYLHTFFREWFAGSHAAVRSGTRTRVRDIGVHYFFRKFGGLWHDIKHLRRFSRRSLDSEALRQIDDRWSY